MRKLDGFIRTDQLWKESWALVPFPSVVQILRESWAWDMVSVHQFRFVAWSMLVQHGYDVSVDTLTVVIMIDCILKKPWPEAGMFFYSYQLNPTFTSLYSCQNILVLTMNQV